MGKIVYHGTFSDKAPHEYGGTFHAGTEKAAKERLDEAEELGGIATMHAYKLTSQAKMSEKMWADSLSDFTSPEKVPKHDSSMVFPYINEWEDAGSTSYVIPAQFVGKSVHYLGPQFQRPRGEGGKAIMNAISTMLGRPQSK